jgi:hypothetical protein
MSDLFAVRCSLNLPERLAVSGRIGGNQIHRVAHPAIEVDALLSKLQTSHGRQYWKATTTEGLTFAIVDFDTASLLDCEAVLKVGDITSPQTIVAPSDLGAKWILPKPRKPGTTDRDAITSSWKGKLQLIGEEYEGHKRLRSGLRPPQLGAIYATKAHWSVSTQAATLVLPTGAGKTDTMVALLVSEQIPCLLVIVPTDPLRRQIGKKFADLDVLKAVGLVPLDLQHPSVTFLSKGLKTTEEVHALVAASNVIRRIRAMMDLECPLFEVRADKGAELLDFSLWPISDIGLDEFLKPAPCGLFHEHPVVAPG